MTTWQKDNTSILYGGKKKTKPPHICHHEIWKTPGTAKAQAGPATPYLPMLDPSKQDIDLTPNFVP